jgi:hypothetical protein
MVRFSPSRKSTLGSQPSFCRAKEMSGCRCFGSSDGNVLKTSGEREIVMNSGKFAFHADIMLDELHNMGRKSPLQRSWAVEGMVRDLDLLRLPAEPFGRAPMKWIDLR